jgi:hypothetical protein
MASHLPPRYVRTPVELLYHGDLPASVRVTAMRIYGLGWRKRHEWTDPVGLDELLEICGVSQSTLYGHLATLGDKRVLSYTTVNVGGERTFVFELLMGAPAGPPPESCPDFRTDSTVVGGGVPSSSESESIPHDEHQQQPHDVAVGGVCEGGDGASGKADGRSEILDRLGVREPTRSELLRLAHVTHRYLKRWLAWYESQESLGTGLVVTQIRHGVSAPRSRRRRAAAGRRGYLAWGGGR